jgi:hypothetical protein
MILLMSLSSSKEHRIIYNYPKTPHISHVCFFVYLGSSCVHNSQEFSTKLGIEAHNPKCEIEFVCGTSRILTSGFMTLYFILTCYSIDLLAFLKSR